MKGNDGLNRDLFMSMVIFLVLMHIGHSTVSILAQQSPYIPAYNSVTECHTPIAATSLPNGNQWIPHNIKASVRNSGDPTSPRLLYACIFQKQSSVTFSVPSVGMYFIRLYFYPASYEDLSMSKALFSVSVAHYTLLRTSKSSYSSDPSNIEYIIKEFCINVDDLMINITFTPSRNSPGAYGFVNKIEIVSMPQDLYYVHGGGVSLPLIGHHSKFFTRNSTALEMMYRLNIGGHSIDTEDDTGMLRIWSEDSPYLTNQATDSHIINPEVNVKYSLSVPAYTAPQTIYSTARTTEPNKYYNLTWHFPLDGSFCYLVRLHFCEVVRDISHANQRVFQVYLDGQTAENHADVINWSGGVGIPVYKDYIVNFTGHSQKKLFLSLALQSTKRLNGPILNGLEIFKLSDHAYNLAGPFPFGNKALQFGMSKRLWNNDLHTATILVRLLSGIFLLTFLWYVMSQLPIRWCPLPVVSLLQVHLNRQRKAFKQLASSDHCRYFTLVEIKAATNNFSNANLIGVGGFGKVYKGHI